MSQALGVGRGASPGGGKLGGLVGGAISSLVGAGAGALLGEAGFGAALSHVANYGLTTLAQAGLPGANLLRGIGSTFEGTSKASDNYLGITNRFAESGVSLDDRVKRQLADRALSQQSFVQNDQLRSKSIFAEESRSENGVSNKITDDAADGVVKALGALTDALKSARDFVTGGDAKR